LKVPEDALLKTVVNSRFSSIELKILLLFTIHPQDEWTINEVAKFLNYSNSWTGTNLDLMVNKKVLSVDWRIRPYIFKLR